MVVMKVGCCGKVLRRLQLTRVPATSLKTFRNAKCFEGGCQHPGELKPQHLSATTHLHNKDEMGYVNLLPRTECTCF